MSIDDIPNPEPGKERISDLSPRQHIAIAGIAQGHKWKDVAERCGVHRQTIREWTREPKFKAELDKVIFELREESFARVRALSEKAVTRLEELLDSEHTPPGVKLSAVTKVLEISGIGTQVTIESESPSLNLAPEQMEALERIAAKYPAAFESDNIND